LSCPILCARARRTISVDHPALVVSEVLNYASLTVLKSDLDANSVRGGVCVLSRFRLYLASSAAFYTSLKTDLKTATSLIDAPASTQIRQ
jgi:hypothetical protein